MPLRVLLIGLLVLPVVGAFGSTAVLDFADWESGHDLPGDWVQSGLEKYASSHKFAGAAYFGGKDDVVVSPRFPEKILSVTVESGTSSESMTRGLNLVPVVNDAYGDPMPLEAPPCESFASQTLDISGLGATKIRLQSTSGSGNWAVRRITVVYGEADPVVPTVKSVGAVKVSGTDADSFRLSWDSVEGAEGYVVNVWTNVRVGVSDGVEVMGERFSSVTNRDYAKEWTVDDLNRLGDYRAWEGGVLRGYPAKTEGDAEHAVVLGTEGGPGWLSSAPLEISGEAVVRLRLTRHTADDTAPLLVAFVKDGLTNFASNVRFGTAVHSFADYSVAASNLTGGCRLVVSSQKKPSGNSFGRVAISEISVRTGVSEGTEVRLPVVEDMITPSCFHLCEGASPVVYGFSVAARFSIDGGNVDSDAVVGEADMADPPWLRCWRASVFLPKPGRRALDLSGMAKVSSARSWNNGTDGDGLYAFADSGADASLRPYSDAATNYAVYWLEEGGGQDASPVLGLLGNGTSGVRLVLPIRLDADGTLDRLSASFVLRRMTWKEKSADTELSFAWAAGDGFDAMTDAKTEWHKVDDSGYVATAVGELRAERTVNLDVRPIRRAKYIFLQWSVPSQANSAMIGLSDLVVEGGLRKTGFFLQVR